MSTVSAFSCENMSSWTTCDLSNCLGLIFTELCKVEGGFQEMDTENAHCFSTFCAVLLELVKTNNFFITINVSRAKAC